VKNKRNPGLLTSSAVLNSGATAFVFFGMFPGQPSLQLSDLLKACREFAISPLLIHFASGEQYAHRRRELGINPLTKNEASSLQELSWTDLRWNKLLDSGLSGMLTGGALRGFRSRYLVTYGFTHRSLRDGRLAGARAIFPGAMIFGAASITLQYGYNELSIVRLRYLSNLRRSTAAEEGGRTAEKAPNDVSEPAFQSLLKFFGFVPISDEEYLVKLRKSREVYLQRIAKLEKQVEEETLLKNSPKQS
jgi:hypothetical protein